MYFRENEKNVCAKIKRTLDEKVHTLAHTHTTHTHTEIIWAHSHTHTHGTDGSARANFLA